MSIGTRLRNKLRRKIAPFLDHLSAHTSASRSASANGAAKGREAQTRLANFNSPPLSALSVKNSHERAALLASRAVDMNAEQLSVAQYDAKEAAAKIRASYPALRSFAPISFAQVGFPTRVVQRSELRRYVDIMHEPDDKEYWLTKEQWSGRERELLLDGCAEVEALSSRLFDEPVQPLMNLFLPMPVVRLIEHLSKEIAGGRKLTVIEIGPGSGYLAAFLLLLGHKYVGIENTQALYLWQHQLLRWMTSDNLKEYALDDAGPPATPDAPAAMIPWWFFAEMYRKPPLRADIVVCDAAIGEMDVLAARYVIRLAKSFLEGSDVGAFLYKNLGEQRQNSSTTVNHLFAHVNGYRTFPCGPVTLQCANDVIPANAFAPLATELPRLNERPGEPLYTAHSFIDHRSPHLLEAYAFFDYLRLSLG